MAAVNRVDHIVDVVLEDETNVLPQRRIIILIIRVGHLLPLQRKVGRLILLLGLLWRVCLLRGGSGLHWHAMSRLLLALKHNGLILVDPALVLYFALDHMVAMHGSDDSTDAAHVEKEVLAHLTVVEAINLVPHSNRHIFLSGDVGLIRSHLENVALVQVDLLVLVRLAEEELGLLAELHDAHDARLMLLRRFPRPLH